MAILSGRLGRVRWDPTGSPGSPGALATLISIKSFKLSQKVNYIDVTCFQDTNKVYVPGLPDTSGSFAGFWNSSDDALWEAAVATTPGLLELTPNTDESGFNWSGLAYLDADLDTSVDGAPAITGTFMAGGPWTRAAS